MASTDRPGIPGSSNGAPPPQDLGRGQPITGQDNATAQAALTSISQAAAIPPSNKKKNRKKKKNKARHESQPQIDSGAVEALASSENTTRDRPFYKLGHATGGNLSDTSIESQALLDHRSQLPMRARRDSRAALPPPDLSASWRPTHSSGTATGSPYRTRQRAWTRGDADEEGPSDSRTPLLGFRRQAAKETTGYGIFGITSKDKSRGRSRSDRSSLSSGNRRPPFSRDVSGYDVNNPPSVPGTPVLGGEQGLDDVLVTDLYSSQSLGLQDRRRSVPGDKLIDIDGDAQDTHEGSAPPTPKDDALTRRHTVAAAAQDDVCFPVEGLSEIAEEESVRPDQPGYHPRHRRRRLRRWPDLSTLEEWSREEKEERSEGIRAKTISEPVLVDGRLRPIKRSWFRREEDAPYRFTYFNEILQSTIHSQTISELLQPGQSFKDLFIPDPPELSDDSSDEEDIGTEDPEFRSTLSPNAGSTTGTRQSSIVGERLSQPNDRSDTTTPQGSQQPAATPGTYERPKRYGSRPIFWLDVLSPTEMEMRVISKAFGIHPLTAEDIMMQEAREKVELFHNYYLVNYRTFEQDSSSENYLEPVNMYVVVFREAVISFHFSLTPHPANVRRRIRQLKDYLELTADWISYAIIDDITDVFAPLIQSIEEEVDEIDDAILQLHSSSEERAAGKNGGDRNSLSEKRSDAGELAPDSGGDMLRRVGEGRKKVMGIYRLIGNKADVIKGFAKRCNEQWDIAPRSDIGLYLGDIQDHVLTMTSNLSHCETLLSRAHSNYLAQINIRMNERQEKTADVLGKLTVLGTIVLPMNIITGMWGMNVLVPGQDIDNLYWFWSITAGLIVFGVSCFFIAKKVYGIV